MEGEKKPRRPRIGDNKSVARESNIGKYERVDYGRRDNGANEERSYNSERPYAPRRSYGEGNSYNNRNNYANNRYGNNNRNNYGNNGGNSYGNSYGNKPRYNQNNNYRQTDENGERNYNTDRPYGNRPAYGNNNRGEGNARQSYGNRNYGNNNNNSYGNRGGYNRGGNGEGGNRYGNGNSHGGYNNGGRNRAPQRENRYPARPRRIEYEMPEVDPSTPIRLNKYMANAGICSRREADEFIQNGEVLVNGTPVTELGTKITRTDVVTFQGKVVTLENKVYVLLNKPKDCVTTSDDPQGRLTVMDIVRNACTERIYPVGRLDRNTTGVLLLTNDGDLASKLTHPKFVKKKIYHVWTDKDVSEEDMQRIADGIDLEDGPIHADAVSYATDTDRNQVGIEIHSGRNRIVRRIFEALGYHVIKLDRVYFAGLTKKNLQRGRWRYLTQQELNMLQMGAFE